MLLLLSILTTLVFFPIVSPAEHGIVALPVATFIAGAAAGGKKNFVAYLASSLGQIVIGYLFASSVASYALVGRLMYETADLIWLLSMPVTIAVSSALVGLMVGRVVQAKLVKGADSGTTLQH